MKKGESRLGPFVIDCSVTLRWFFVDEQDAYALACLDALAESQAIAPALWLLELTNGLLGAGRRGRLSFEEITSALTMLAELGVEVDKAIPSPATLFTLARQYSLTSYDATYLELGMRAGVPIATNDRALRRAATEAGVGIWGDARA